MRTFAFALGALAVAALVHPGSAAAQDAKVYPWCANEEGGVESCSFTTLQQCQETISGIGGSCSINPEAARPRAQDSQLDEFVPLGVER